MDGSDWATAVDALAAAPRRSPRACRCPRWTVADPAAGYLATLSTLDPAQLTAALAAAARGEAGTPPEWPSRRRPGSPWPAPSSSPGRSTLPRAPWPTWPRGDDADWRITWYQGLRELAVGHPAAAQAAFDAVYDALPGELAPQLALGFAAEAAGDRRRPPPATSGACGWSTAPTSAPRSAWPGPGWRRTTGPGRSRRWPRCRRHRATTWRRRSRRCGSTSPRAGQSGARLQPTCGRPAGWTG